MKRWPLFLCATMLALCAATPAHAGPVPAFVTAAFGVFGVGPIATAAIATQFVIAAASLGVNYVLNSLTKRPQPNAPQGITVQLRSGGDLFRTFMAGQFATGGSLSYAGTWGQDGDTQNAYITYVVPLSDIRAQELTGLWVHDAKATWDAAATPTKPQGVPIMEYRHAGEDNLWVKFSDGTQTVADPFLVSTFGGDPVYPYTSDMIGHGVSYVIVTARWNQALFTGYPSYKWGLKGGLFYDPRFDTTVGGSGTQRWNDQATWVWTENNIVIAYNIMRGLSYGGEHFWGPQNVNAARFPLASWFAAMNECDLTVDDGEGGTAKQYRCGTEISVDMEPLAVVEELLKGCNARIAEVGGLYKPLVGAVAPAVYAFTDADIIIDKSRSYDPFKGLERTINGLTASFPDPTKGYETNDAPAHFSAALEAEDGKRLTTNINYGTTPYLHQVERNMDSAVEEARKFRTHAGALPPTAYVLEPNNVAEWNSDQNGYIDKSFRMEAMVLTESLLFVPVSIVECNPADYDFDPDTDFVPGEDTTIDVVSNFPPPITSELEKARALLRRVEQLFDHYAEMDIGLAYNDIIRLPGLVAGVSAEVSIEKKLRASDVAAMAELILAARAEASGAFAESLIKFVAAAGPEGVLSRIAILTRVSQGGAFAEAAAYFDTLLDAGNLVSQIYFKANRIVLDGIVLLQGGVLTEMLAANAATLPGYTAGTATPSPTANVWNLITSFTDNFKGSLPLNIQLGIEFDNTDSGEHNYVVAVTYDSTDPDAGTPVYKTGGNLLAAKSPARTHFSFPAIHFPGDSSHTYRIYYKPDAVNVRNRLWIITYQEVRR